MKFIAAEEAEKLDVYKLWWEYEDDLPNIPERLFNMMFKYSKIKDGVRMYPVYLDMPIGELYYVI